MAVHPHPSSAVATDLVYTDDLTGLRNRRFLYRLFGEGWGEVTEAGAELSLAIVDLDYFKQVNDTHGHLTGDLVLAETGALIEGLLGGEDRAIRYGGDEFVLVLPSRSKTESGELVERLRHAMADKEFVSKEEQQPLDVVLSFSIGVATFPEDGTSGEELMAAADKALYASKKSGRNCVTLSGELPAGLEDEIDRFRTFPSKTLVGRQDEIETLASLCELLGMGTGTWTALSGPAGIGKSRLLHEALRLAPESGISCVLVDLLEDMARQPFAGMAMLLSEIASRRPKIFDNLFEKSDEALLTFLQAHAPEVIPPWLEPEQSTSAPSAETIRKTLERTMKFLCQGQKWLLLIDGAAYLDSHSSELLRFIIEEERLPIGVVSAHRGNEGNVETSPGSAFLESLERRPWFDHHPVGPLPGDSTEVLVSVLLPNHHAPSEFAELVQEITAGNPLFVEEILRIGIAKKKITRRGGEWFVQPLEREELPSTLEEAIGRRISLLDEEVGQGISRASAIGNSFTPEVLQALLGKNEGEILDFLDKARDQGLVRGGRQGDLSKIRFASSAFRDQAYKQMDEVERTRAHREIGKIEEHRAGSLVGVLASRLAYHFERGEVFEKARTYLDAARSSTPPIIVAGSWDATEVPKHRRRRITEAAVPLPEAAWPTLDDTLRAIAQATKSLWMYPDGSPIAEAAFGDLHRQLESVFEHAEVISLASVEDTLVVNGVPYPAKRQEFLVQGLLDQLKTRDIRGFTIRQGMTEREAAFLVSQLASDEPVERDPEAWEALLEKQQIENVDFGDRVYVPAEGVANAPVSATEVPRRRSGVIRVASAAEMEGLAQEASQLDFDRDASQQAERGGSPRDLQLSPEDFKALVGQLEADAVVNAQIVELVPVVSDLLRKLLESGDEETRVEYGDLVRAFNAEPQAPVSDSDDYLLQIRSERDPVGKKSLLGPAEQKFETFVQTKHLASARTVLRFIRQCQAFDDEESELAVEGAETLSNITTGGTVQLLLADLLAMPEKPDQEALNLLREIGSDAGPILVTFLRETDDLRARRIVARLLKEIGGETLGLALVSITHGDKPVVARRVIGVLDCLSTNLIGDLSRAVQVRNPGVLGEAIKTLQRQPRTIQVQVIGSLLDSASPELVCRGIYYLGEWNLSEAKGKVLTLLGQSKNQEILAAITAALARWRLAEAVPILGELLGKRQVMRLLPAYPRGLRREFARALAAIGTPEAQVQLAEFTKDVDSEVRNIARGMSAPTGA